MPTPTDQLYLAEQARVAATLAAVRREWDSARTPRQAQRLLPRLTSLVAAAMAGAAEDGAASVDAALAEQGRGVRPMAVVNPPAFGWSASDGRPLDSLLAGGVVRSQSSMTAGRMWLDIAVHTQVADASRAGSSVAIATRPRTGYIRYVNPPSCQNCAVLAGKWFKWNTGFRRHPRCDCQHRPWSQDEPLDGYVLDVPLDQISDLTDGQRKALEDGADLSQVVNAYRRSKPEARASLMFTSEGTTRRGWAAHVQRQLNEQRSLPTAMPIARPSRGARPTPDAIYRFSQSREEAVRLLAANGYVVGDAQLLARLAS